MNINMPRGLKQAVGKAKAIYSYSAIKDDELSLKPGDMINVYKMDLPDQGWWMGEVNGSIGVFPENFVRLLSNEDRNQGDDSSHIISDLNSKVPPPKPVLPPQPKVSAINKPKLTPKVKEPHILNAFSGNQSAEGFDCIKSSSKLSHITAGRVKGPIRRPPTRPSIDKGEEAIPKPSAPTGNTELSSSRGFGKEPNCPEEIREKSEDKPLEVKKQQKPGACPQQKLTDNVLKSDAKVERVPMEEYEAMQKELQALKADLKEQAQTNERMVQTLRNFLQEEREKIKLLTAEFNQIKASYLSKISFL